MIHKLKSLFSRKPAPQPVKIPKISMRLPSVIAFAGADSEEMASIACLMVESMDRPARTFHPNRLVDIGVAAMFGWSSVDNIDPVLHLDGRAASAAVKLAIERVSPGVWLRAMDVVASSVAPGVLVLFGINETEARWVVERGGIVIASESSPVQTSNRVPDFVPMGEMPELILQFIGEKHRG